MAITFDEETHRSFRSIPLLFYKHINLLDPCFAAFNRLFSLEICSMHLDDISADLSPISGVSFRVDLLKTDKYILHKMAKFHRDKEVNFILQSLYIDNRNYEEFISNEDVDFINKLNPKMLEIYCDIYDAKNIKTLALLKCANIKAYYNKDCHYEYSSFLLANTLIKLFDSESDQMNTFECESVKFFVCTEDIEKMIILKTNTGNSLFIPLEIIDCILISRFKEKPRKQDINKQFADLKIETCFKDSGFIVPIKYISKMLIELDDFLSSNNYQMEDIEQLFEEKQEKLTVENLVRFLEHKGELPNGFSQINFKCFEIHLTNIEKYLKPEIIDYQNCISLKYYEISRETTHSPDKFYFWCNVLRLKGVRFNLTKICLWFRSLSECLTVLSLCSDCPELKSISFIYSEADTKNEHEKVEQAKKNFIQKFGFIQELNIWKECEGY